MKLNFEPQQPRVRTKTLTEKSVSAYLPPCPSPEATTTAAVLFFSPVGWSPSLRNDLKIVRTFVRSLGRSLPGIGLFFFPLSVPTKQIERELGQQEAYAQ